MQDRQKECPKVRMLLSAYLDGELEQDESDLVQAHLVVCSACAEELRTLQETVHLLHKLPKLTVPRSFAITAPPPRTARLLLLQRATATVAALLLILAMAGLLLGQVAIPSLSKPAATPEVVGEARVKHLESAPVPPPKVEKPLTPAGAGPEGLALRAGEATPSPGEPTPSPGTWGEVRTEGYWLSGAIQVLLLLLLILSTATFIVWRREKSRRWR
ncbi:MAG: zf-HC2 domain-containing protein [Chloroflexi bacterium]|nr:zf-HC2 domain-containing protein [Chloroflexota bacterium]